ncbi:MAG: T9SS type A sorting domain-containing protein [Bacteroidales bacterium]|nr:T9SS type A sorting domain-containing protein [Bacteroidales bacterium]
MITSFPSGDWFYNTINLTINGNQVVNDFAMLCFGDVNSSYAPAKKDKGSVYMVYEGTQIIQSFTAFEISVSIQDMIEAGAISLGILYPEEYMQVNEVELINTNGSVIFTAEEGLCRIAWADLNALNLTAGDEMLVLHCTANDLSNMQGPIQLSLNANCEFADPSAQVLDNITLSVPQLTTLAVGIGNAVEDGLWLSENYPNPFSNSTTIRYQIPAQGHVSLKVMDITGKTVSELVNWQHAKGEYFVEFNGDRLEAGIYFYKLEFSNSENHNSLVNKMSVTR